MVAGLGEAPVEDDVVVRHHHRPLQPPILEQSVNILIIIEVFEDGNGFCKCLLYEEFTAECPELNA